MGTFNDERVREMLRGRLAVKPVPFPGLEGVDIGIRALADAEVDSARVRATQYVKEQRVDLDVDTGFLDREIQRQLIWRSTSDPSDESKDPAPFFGSDKDVRRLDPPTIAALWALYVEHQEHISPVRTLDKQELKEMVDALGKGPVAGLIHLSPATLRACVHSMASAIRERSLTPKPSTSPSASEPVQVADR